MNRSAKRPPFPRPSGWLSRSVASYGAVSSADGFYCAAQEFADEHFGHDEAMKSLQSATDALRPYLPKDKHQAFELVDAIHCAVSDIEFARWKAMWLLGVCVGVRLGGGR